MFDNSDGKVIVFREAESFDGVMAVPVSGGSPVPVPGTLAGSALIYGVARHDSRSEIARGLLAGGGVFSVHVLNEFVAVARRKLRKSWKEVSEALAILRVVCPLPLAITVETHERAVSIAQAYGYDTYDSLVIAAAQQSRCTTLYSADMQDGHRIGNLTITNPFLTAKPSPLKR